MEDTRKVEGADSGFGIVTCPVFVERESMGKMARQETMLKPPPQLGSKCTDNY